MSLYLVGCKNYIQVSAERIEEVVKAIDADGDGYIVKFAQLS